MKGRMYRKLRNFAAAIVLLVYTAPLALAGSVTQPGETIGLPNGTAAPEGWFLADEANFGCRNTSPQTCVLVNIPLIAWSTPWKIFGGRLVFATSPAPAGAVGVENTTYIHGLFNPFVSAVVGWDLGQGWGFGYLLGAYIDVDTPTAFSSSSLNQRFALSYTGDGWDLTANVIWGINFDQVTNNPQGFPCPPVLTAFPTNGCNPNFLNIDLTATKKFGKWELGPVAFGSSDISTPVPSYQRQSQFAVGGLVGYWFGPVTLQAYVTTDVYEKNYGGKDTRLWTRIVVPILSQPPPAARSLGVP